MPWVSDQKKENKVGKKDSQATALSHVALDEGVCVYFCVCVSVRCGVSVGGLAQ